MDPLSHSNGKMVSEETHSDPLSKMEDVENDDNGNAHEHEEPAVKTTFSSIHHRMSVSMHKLSLSSSGKSESFLIETKTSETEIITLEHTWSDYNIVNLFFTGKCKICNKTVTFNNAASKCTRCTSLVHTTCLKSLTDKNRTHCDPPYKKLILNATMDCSPLIVFVNPKSGGQNGLNLFTQLQLLLGKTQVFDVTDGGPSKGLNMYRTVPNLKILVAGGDGSVGWILSEIDKIEWVEEPSVAVLPLGTGNDLARTLKWGGGYDGEDLIEILKKVLYARRVQLDRWQAKITNDEGTSYKFVNNYFSIGSDAGIALGFHTMRNERPELFKSRAVNKMWYAFYGGKQVLSKEIKINNYVDIMVNDEFLSLPDAISGLIITNLSSYAGGVNLWGTQPHKEFSPPSYNDGILEIVGVKGSMEMGTITSGMAKPTKIAQARNIKIVFKSGKISLPVQVDGEPWIENGPCTIELKHLKQSTMLYNTTDK